MTATITKDAQTQATFAPERARPESIQQTALEERNEVAQTAVTCLDVPVRRIWTRAEYERMAEVGIFHPEERLELIEGDVVERAIQTPAHATAICLAEDALRAIPRTDYHIRIHGPLNLGEYNQPEPDIAVVVGSIRDFTDEHPDRAVMVVEVSDTTLTFDRTTKAAIYARAGIPDYWITDINNRVLEIYRDHAPMQGYPLGFGYRSVTRYTETQSVSPLAVPTYSILVAELLPGTAAVSSPTIP